MPALLRHLDRLRGSALARRLRRSSVLDRVYRASRGAVVRQSARFALNELRPRPTVHRYELRESGRTVVIRHHTDDVGVLDEIFWWGFYDPPSAARPVLDRGIRTIVDIGGHAGLWATRVSDLWPAAEVVALEPDPTNAALHERVIEANGAGDRWRIVRACAGVAEGTVRFRPGRGADSHVPERPRPDDVTVPVVDAFDYLMSADLIKIDAEGAEWTILADARLRSIPARAIVLEYHTRMCPGDDARATAEQLLRAAGYETECTEHHADGLGVLWAWRAPSA